ncbi:hypothetical protein J6590_030211 [Homalodisca vitripennis]|nr:hypothetical protein J6590_030211 [Homalodisca vitripennis]
MKITFDSECGVILYEDQQNDDYNDRAWGPSLPFLGPSLAQRLMGERRVFGDWDRTQFQGKVIGD